MVQPPGLLGRHGNEKAGALVIITVLLFAVALVQSGRLRDWFDPGAKLRVLLPPEGLLGLSEGATVDILGTPAGRVEALVLDDGKELHAEVSIRSEMMEFVRQDSPAVIRKRFGVAGDSFLEIGRGEGAQMDWSYAVLTATADHAPIDLLSELVVELRDKVLPTIDSAQAAVLALADITHFMADPQGDFRASLASLRDISGRLQRGEGAVGALLGDSTLVADLERVVRDAGGSVAQLNVLLSATQARVGEVEPILTDLRSGARSVAEIGSSLREGSEAVPAITVRARSVLESLDKVLADVRRTSPDLPRISRGLAQTSENLPALLLQTQSTAAELERLVEQLRASWLIGGKDGVPAPVSRRLSPLEVSP